MNATIEVIVRGGRMDPAGSCVVCGEEVPAGDGFAARWGEREFRFKCARCVYRFEADPGPYLAADSTRPGEAEVEAEGSPASEWACY